MSTYQLTGNCAVCLQNSKAVNSYCAILSVDLLERGVNRHPANVFVKKYIGLWLSVNRIIDAGQGNMQFACPAFRAKKEAAPTDAAKPALCSR